MKKTISKNLSRMDSFNLSIDSRKEIEKLIKPFITSNAGDDKFQRLHNEGIYLNISKNFITVDSKHNQLIWQFIRNSRKYKRLYAEYKDHPNFLALVRSLFGLTPQAIDPKFSKTVMGENRISYLNPNNMFLKEFRFFVGLDDQHLDVWREKKETSFALKQTRNKRDFLVFSVPRGIKPELFSRYIKFIENKSVDSGHDDFQGAGRKDVTVLRLIKLFLINELVAVRKVRIPKTKIVEIVNDLLGVNQGARSSHIDEAINSFNELSVKAPWSLL